jgi:hypothetical protein
VPIDVSYVSLGAKQHGSSMFPFCLQETNMGMNLPHFEPGTSAGANMPQLCNDFGKFLSLKLGRRSGTSGGLYTHPSAILVRARNKNISSSCHSFEKKRAHAGVMYVVLEQSHIKCLGLALEQANMVFSVHRFERSHVACISQFADFFDPELEARPGCSERAGQKHARALRDFSIRRAPI